MLKSDYDYPKDTGESFEFEGQSYPCKDYFLFENWLYKREYVSVDNGELWGIGIDPEAGEAFNASEPDPNEDPEGWRMYADVIDTEQIEWLKKNPEHDWGGALERLKKRGDSRVADWNP